VTFRPYNGQAVALATQHQKHLALGPPFAQELGATVVLAAVDTDALGTFTGDRPRVGTAEAVCAEKARLGMAALGLPLGLASEGSFGPHPDAPFLVLGVEVLVFVDALRGLEVVERLVAERTNFGHREVATADELAPWLPVVGFPEHALVVQPLGAAFAAASHKGLRDGAALRSAVQQAAAASPQGRALVSTDMRAHCNPTRMGSIATLGQKLARRLATPCPVCAAPGFGRVEVVPGLPCGFCGEATQLVLAERYGCAVCTHRELRPRADGRTSADPGSCELCNP
jgi:hypothetical protein